MNLSAPILLSAFSAYSAVKVKADSNLTCAGGFVDCEYGLVRGTPKYVTVNDVVNVLAMDSSACNGVIYVTDALMLPPGEELPANSVDPRLTPGFHTLDTPQRTPPGGRRLEEELCHPTVWDIGNLLPNFSKLMELVDATDLEEIVTGPGLVTVFAPTNDALDALPEGTFENWLLPENKDQLTGILLYTVVNGTIPYPLITSTVTTLQGDDVSIVDSTVPCAEVCDGMCCDGFTCDRFTGLICKGGDTICSQSSDYKVKVDIVMDYYGSETTWNLMDQCSESQVGSGGPYSPYEQVVEEYCRPAAQYNFTIYDSYGDGICLCAGGGNVEVSVDGVLEVEEIGEFTFKSEHVFSSCEAGGPSSCIDSILNVAGTGGRGCASNQRNCDSDASLSHCPLSCNSCNKFGCVDSTASFEYGSGRYTCGDLASFSDSQIETYCNVEAAYSTCRGTCNTCINLPLKHVGLNASDIPRVRTPSPGAWPHSNSKGCGFTGMPYTGVLSECTEPLHPDAPDMAGYWQVRETGEIQELEEQCGSRWISIHLGVIHDFLECTSVIEDEPVCTCGKGKQSPFLASPGGARGPLTVLGATSLPTSAPTRREIADRLEGRKGRADAPFLGMEDYSLTDILTKDTLCKPVTANCKFEIDEEGNKCIVVISNWDNISRCLQSDGSLIWVHPVFGTTIYDKVATEDEPNCVKCVGGEFDGVLTRETDEELPCAYEDRQWIKCDEAKSSSGDGKEEDAK